LKDIDNNKMEIKDDLNFLEYPMFVVNEDRIVKGVQGKSVKIIKDIGTYTIETSITCDLPRRKDKILLYYLLYLAKIKNNNEIFVSGSQLIKKAYGILRPGKREYERLQETLRVWASVRIEFKGLFYIDGYRSKIFSILNTWKEGKRTYYIEFNKEYLQQLKDSIFYKVIDINKYKILKRPISTRLYEILLKSFVKTSKTFPINIFKLSEKLTLSYKYKSQIIRSLNPAITEINNSTDMTFKMTYLKDKELLIFELLENLEIYNSEKSEEIKSKIRNDLGL